MGLIAKLIDRHRRRKAVRTVILTEDGLEIRWSYGLAPARFRWQDVSEVRTYKVDLWSYDDACLAFRVGEQWHEISEEDSVFQRIMAQLGELFPGVAEDWYLQVIFPAFAANERVIWSSNGKPQ